jgi:hypothetical protein
MNARIFKEFSFFSAIHAENTFSINSYTIGLDIDVNTEDMREQNIAMERIKFALGTIEDCVFVNENEKTSIENYSKAGLKVCTLPDEPYDQVIAVVLLRKLNSVAEGRLVITDISIQSLTCDDIKFFVSIEETTEFSARSNAWWNENNISIACIDKKSHKKEKVVSIKKEFFDWGNLGLNWKEITEKNKPVLIELPNSEVPK